MKNVSEKTKRFLYEGLNDHQSRQYAPINIVISVATIVSIITIILESVNELNAYLPIFTLIEHITIVIFIIEYITRIITAPKKLAYILSFWGLIDLISIIPTFIGFANMDYLESIRMLRIIRFVRVLRLIKISRVYIHTSNEEQTEGSIIKINMTIYLLAVFSVAVIFGSILHIVEASQDAYLNIPLAMLQVITMLVGGSFVTATTTFGEIIIVLIKFMGLALFGLLINIVTEILKKWLLGNKIEGVSKI